MNTSTILCQYTDHTMPCVAIQSFPFNSPRGLASLTNKQKTVTQILGFFGGKAKQAFTGELDEKFVLLMYLVMCVTIVEGSRTPIIGLTPASKIFISAKTHLQLLSILNGSSQF